MLIEKFDELKKLDDAISRLLDEMVDRECDSEPYAKMADQLTKLIKTKEILGNLKLKAFEATQKKEDAANTLVLKSREMALKEDESHRQNELKKRELLDRMDEVQDLYALKKREVDLKQAEFEKPDSISKDTLAIVGANVAGIVMILVHERASVIASKALGFIMRAR